MNRAQLAARAEELARQLRAGAAEVRDLEAAKRDGVTLATIRQGSRQEIRARWRANRYLPEGRRPSSLDLRVWENSCGEWLPLRGVGIGIDSDLLPQLAEVLAIALELAKGQPL
jgi:hypothetical protein